MLPFRSLRASWTGVSCRIDGEESIHLEQTKQRVLHLPPGHHELHVSAKGFVPATATINLAEGKDAIIAITPGYQVGVAKDSPLGSLKIRTVEGPGDLQPYQFYRSLPSSIGRRSVWPSVLLSLMACSALVGLGLAAIAATMFGYLTRGIGTGLFLTACAIVIASLAIPAGLSGIAIGIRFLRLPLLWRSPAEP